MHYQADIIKTKRQCIAPQLHLIRVMLEIMRYIALIMKIETILNFKNSLFNNSCSNRKCSKLFKVPILFSKNKLTNNPIESHLSKTIYQLI